MSQPGPPGDHSARSLAEILREHGLESEFGTRPGRRRRENDSKADWPARPAPENQPPSRLRPAAAGPAARPAPPREAPTPPPRPQDRPVVSQAEAAEILREHGLETELGTRPGRRRAAGGRTEQPASPAPEDRSGSRLRPPTDPAAAARVARPRDVPREEVRSGSAAPPAPGRPPSRSAPVVPPRTPRGGSAAAGPASPAVPTGREPRSAGVPTTDDPVATGSFAAVVAGAAAAGDGHEQEREEPPTAGQSALAWARFAAELLLAVAVGVGTYFAFTVLWELVPYVAVVAAPLVLTGLVAGVAAWRHRREQAQLGVRLLAVLVFAGTLLVIAPAASLLSTG